MTLYAVTNGKYSDYHIVGITSDKVVAEKYAEMRNRARDKYESEFWVEEYSDLAEAVNMADEGKKLYQIIKNTATNTVDGGEEKYRLNRPINAIAKWENGKKQKMLGVYLWATDYDAAKKIALDKFNEYEARKNELC